MTLTNMWLQAAVLKQRGKAARKWHRAGIYPHWARYESRDGQGKPIHMMRPSTFGINESEMTCCGFLPSNFRAGSKFGIPRQPLMSAPRESHRFYGLANQVTCSICYEVLGDIATWIGIAQEGPGPFVALTHCSYPGHGTFCDLPPPGCIYNAVDPYSFYRSTPLIEACGVCKSIWQRLYGNERPEFGWQFYETLEQAANALKTIRGSK